MDNPNHQVKECTTAAYDYLLNKSDKNSVVLQKQLQSVSLINDLEIFDSSSSETLELYLSLEKFLTPTEARSTIAGKVLALFAHISESCTIRAALRDDIKILPVISNFLVNSKLSKDNLLKTLNLMSVISYRIKVVYLEGWMMEVTPFLVATITDGTIGDECLVAALQTLTNLCRSNPPVMECLRRCPNIKMLPRTLGLIKKPTMYIRLLILEMQFFIFGDKMNNDFTVSNLVFSNNKILDMIFSVAIEGVKENQVSWLQLAADVFEELALMPPLEAVFREYKNYVPHIQLLLSHLVPASPDVMNEALIHLMSRLVKFTHQDIKSLHQAIFLKVTECLHSPRCGQSGVQVLRELLTNAATNTFTSTTMDTLVEAIKMCLTFGEDCNVTHNELQHITVILDLVDHISTSNEALQLKFAWKLEPSLFSNLLKKTLILDSNCLADDQDEKSSNSTSSSGYDSLTSSRHGTASCQAEGTCVSRYNLKLSLRKIVSKAVILILAVIKELGAVKAEHLVEYRKMMGTAAVMSHLMWGGQSGLTEYATRAWDIISDGKLSKECLDALVAATEESSSRGKSVPEPHTMTFNSQNASPILSADLGEKMDAMIARLGGTARKMELKDCALSDVMDLYEYKLSSLTHSEQSLQKALMKADIQNRQSCLLQLQTNIQNDHLRSLLVKWQSRNEKVKAEKSELQATIEMIKESSKQNRENFINEKEKLEKDTKSMQKNLLTMKGFTKTTEDKITKLQQQLSDKVEQVKSQHNKLLEEQENKLKLSKQIQKLEEELKQGTRSLETLKKEIESLENIKLQLNKENSDLELLVKSKDEVLVTKEEELEEALVKLDKMAQIQNMIHDISSRRVDK